MRNALGRGLEALIPEIGSALKANTAGTAKISIEKIKPNKYQPREVFDEDAIKELADSIMEHGLVQPILVLPRGEDGYFEIVAGERRWRAAKQAGLSEIPAIIKPLSEKDSFIISLIENLQRRDLNPLEEAVAYKRLMTEFQLTQEELAKSVGKTRSGIANTIRLLQLPDSIQNALLENKITEGHARAIASINDREKQTMLLEKIINQHLTVRDVEKASRQIKNVPPSKNPEIVSAEENLQRILGTKVEIKHHGKAGKLIISYYSVTDLNRIMELIQKAGG